MQLRTLLVTGASLLWASTALAQNPSPRVAVIIGETVDGASATSSTAETEITSRLIKAGYQVAERFETAGIRSEISVEKLLTGSVSSIKLSVTNVDYVVIGKVQLQIVAAAELPYGVKSQDTYKGRIDIRIITVDSGRVVDGVVAEKASPTGAVGTTKILIDESWKTLEGSLAKASTARTSLGARVSGLRGVEQADALAGMIGKIPGVAGAIVRSVDADATIYDISAPKLDISTLTAPLSAQGLTITKRSANVVEARYDEAKAGRRMLAVAGFKNSTGKAAYDWIGSTLPSIVETELTNSNYLVPVPLATRPTLDPEKIDTKALAELGKAGAQVVLVGSADLVGSKLRLSYRVYSVDGSPLAAVQDIKDPETAAEIAQSLAWQADAQLYKKLVGASNLAPYVSPFSKYTPTPSTPTNGKPSVLPPTPIASATKGAAKLRVNDIVMEDIFPAKLASYIDHPMGKLVVENPGSSIIEDIKIQISVEGLLSSPQTISASPVAAGKTSEISLPLLLEAEKAKSIKDRRPARVDIVVSYVSGGAPIQENFTKSIMVEGHRAIDWRDPDSFASFVTPEDPSVVAFAQAALSSKAAATVPNSVPNAVKVPMVLFNSLVALGTKYQSDPLIPYGESPIDRVSLPQDMLGELRGDCDDLSALYSSLLYAAGVRTRLITTPGHIFVAVDTNLPLSSRALLEVDAEHTVAEWAGKAYIPVEITKLDKGFLDAWKEGSRELARYSTDPSKVQTIDLEAAWKLYPPFPGGSMAKAPKLPADEKLAALLGGDSKAFDAPVAGSITDPKKALEAGVLAAIRRDSTSAKSLFETAAADKDNKAKALINLGNLEVVNKDYAAAEKHYNEAIKAGTPTEDEIAYTDLGIALYMKGDSKKATDAFKKAKSPEASGISQKLGLEKIPAEKPAKPTKPTGSSKPPAETATTSTGAVVTLKPRAAPPKKPQSLAGLRGDATIDPFDYVRWAK